jgi:hypothetical protein
VLFTSHVLDATPQRGLPLTAGSAFYPCPLRYPSVELPPTLLDATAGWQLMPLPALADALLRPVNTILIRASQAHGQLRGVQHGGTSHEIQRLDVGAEGMEPMQGQVSSCRQ